MKLATDIRSIFEDDVKRLTEAFMTGEIPVPSADSSNPSYMSNLHEIASDIIRFQLESKMLSLVIPFLGSMKWLSLDEACMYARKSRNTILDLIKEGSIYGTKADGGEWIVDRATIDAHYNEERLALQEKFRDLRRAS